MVRVIPGWCASTRPKMRNCASENREIPGSLSRPGMTATRSLLYQRAGAFRKRTEGLVGRRGADQLVIVPWPLGFLGLLDLEEIGRVQLAAVDANGALAEQRIVG